MRGTCSERRDEICVSPRETQQLLSGWAYQADDVSEAVHRVSAASPARNTYHQSSQSWSALLTPVIVTTKTKTPTYNSKDKELDQSSLAKCGIAPRLYSPGGSSNLQLNVLAAGFDPKSPLPLGVRDPI